MKAIDFWKQDEISLRYPFVVFANGTYVQTPAGLGEREQADFATTWLREHGEVTAGHPSGDIRVVALKSRVGWIGVYNEWRMLNFLACEIVPVEREHIAAAMRPLRDMRAADWQDPVVIYQHSPTVAI